MNKLGVCYSLFEERASKIIDDIKSRYIITDHRAKLVHEDDGDKIMKKWHEFVTLHRGALLLAKEKSLDEMKIVTSIFNATQILDLPLLEVQCGLELTSTDIYNPGSSVIDDNLAYIEVSKLITIVGEVSDPYTFSFKTTDRCRKKIGVSKEFPNAVAELYAGIF